MPIPTVLVIFPAGFEEIEAVTPVDLLRRAGALVTLASLAEGMHVTGRNGMTLHTDGALSAFESGSFDCIVLPGGPGVKLLSDDERVAGLLRRQLASDGWIAAICAAPLALDAAGILKGRRFTAHASVAADLPGALLDEKVVVDGRIITSRGAGTALDFGLMIIEKLISRDKAAEVAKSICT